MGKKIPRIKPSRARKIIRRFHLLINKRRVICRKLDLAISDNDEATCSATILEAVNSGNLQKFYEEGWKEIRPSNDLEAKMLSVQNITDKSTLTRILGYIMCEIHEHGGLKNYQMASTIGQDGGRGGDSSKLLVKWLRELPTLPSDFRALEIGSLSARNYISTSGVFDQVVRIDLNSNDAANIQSQDFMQRPIPNDDSERFDVISCSLVLNFVPSPLERGAMLKRLLAFLRRDVTTTYVFIVLPLPCIVHSRYMSESLFCEIMAYLGYTRTQYYEAKKIAYFLFEKTMNAPDTYQRDSQLVRDTSKFTKKLLIHDKPGLNNFSVLL